MKKNFKKFVLFSVLGISLTLNNLNAAEEQKLMNNNNSNNHEEIHHEHHACHWPVIRHIWDFFGWCDDKLKMHDKMAHDHNKDMKSMDHNDKMAHDHNKDMKSMDHKIDEMKKSIDNDLKDVENKMKNMPEETKEKIANMINKK